MRTFLFRIKGCRLTLYRSLAAHIADFSTGTLFDTSHLSDFEHQEGNCRFFVFLYFCLAPYMGKILARAQGLVGKPAPIQEERRRRPVVPRYSPLCYGDIKHQITAFTPHKVSVTLSMHFGGCIAGYKRTIGLRSVAAATFIKISVMLTAAC